MTQDVLRVGFDEAWRECQGVQGWLSAGQAEALFTAAERVGAGDWIVEIGSHHGRSTVVLALAKDPAAGLLAVDPWDAPRWGGGEGSEEAFKRNLEAAGVSDRVTVFKGLSTEAVQSWDRGSIGLLFIDGAHDYPSVIADIEGWEPFVAPGGTVAIHDAFSALGVTRAILSRHLFNRRFRFVGNRRTLALYRRDDLSTPAAIASAASQLLRLAYFARNLLVKVAIKRGSPRLARLLGHSGDVYPY